ncbi:MAG: DUF58 domain-containing protein, partial [Defluviitaleaceae bacterium]|nr:DUF58 domain-containing protein [Defluviitaleaceae bacterium]
GAFVLLYESPMTYMALYVVLALPLLSLALILASKRHFFVVGWLTKADITKGEQTQYVIDVANRSFLPASSVRVRFDTSHPAIITDMKDQYLSIMPRKSNQIAFNVSAKYRGNYTLGIKSIVVFDFLGLFKFQQKQIPAATLIVRPLVADIEYLKLVPATSGTEDFRDFSYQEDYSVISDLRKYQPTDGYKRIHWKVSAKKGELTSKNFQSAKRNTAAVVIDNSKIFGDSLNLMSLDEALETEDAMMQTCVSALAQCVKRQKFCSLHYLGGNTQTFGYSSDFDYLYDAACSVQFDTYEPSAFEKYIADFAEAHGDADNLIIITKDLTDAVFAACSTLKTYGNNIILFCFGDKEWQNEKIGFLRDLDIEVMHYAQN